MYSKIMIRIGWTLVVIFIAIPLLVITNMLIDEFYKASPQTPAQTPVREEQAFFFYPKGVNLITKVSVQEVENGNEALSDKIFSCIKGAPAYINVVSTDEWNMVKAQIKAGDEIWLYCSSPESWKKLGGELGFVLLREKVVVSGLKASIYYSGTHGKRFGGFIASFHE